MLAGCLTGCFRVYGDATPVRLIFRRSARGIGSKDSRLCWYPLYAFVHRSAYSPADAEDLTQGFFARLLERNWIARAERYKGRFRPFLLMAMKRFLANEWDKAKSLKRRAGCDSFRWNSMRPRPVTAGHQRTRIRRSSCLRSSGRWLRRRRWMRNCAICSGCWSGIVDL
jgi:hypothetical protein